ncbi:MAG: hypothetical protein V8Q82_08280 [Christensenellales bacterium]
MMKWTHDAIHVYLQRFEVGDTITIRPYDSSTNKLLERHGLAAGENEIKGDKQEIEQCIITNAGRSQVERPAAIHKHSDEVVLILVKHLLTQTKPLALNG